MTDDIVFVARVAAAGCASAGLGGPGDRAIGTAVCGGPPTSVSGLGASPNASFGGVHFAAKFAICFGGRVSVLAIWARGGDRGPHRCPCHSGGFYPGLTWANWAADPAPGDR